MKRKTIILKSFFFNLRNWHKKNRINYPWRNEKRIFIRCIVELLLKRTTAEAVCRNWHIITKIASANKVNNMSLSDIKKRISKFGLVESRSLEIKALANSHLKKSLRLMEYSELIKIPGIGKYTASAILCFVANKRFIIIDSNISRVISRILGENLSVSSDVIYTLLNAVISKNARLCKISQEAILDFSKLICRPSYPKCTACFINNKCYYFKNKSINKTIALFYY